MMTLFSCLLNQKSSCVGGVYEWAYHESKFRGGKIEIKVNPIILNRILFYGLFGFVGSKFYSINVYSFVYVSELR